MAIFGHIDNFDITTPVAKISQNLKISIFFCSTYIGEWKPHSAFFIYAFFQFSTHPTVQGKTGQYAVSFPRANNKQSYFYFVWQMVPSIYNVLLDMFKICFCVHF